MDYRIFPPEDMIEVSVGLPRSKSLSNRALLINALSGEKGELKNLAECDDTRAMAEGLHAGGAMVNVGAAGTAMRFLTAYYARLQGSVVTIDGSERMRHRPIGVLVDALRSLGASIEYVGDEGFPPLRIEGRRLAGGDITLPASVSSQYVSALLMIAPGMTDGLRLTLDGDVASRPYIAMTLGLMRQWGVDAEWTGNCIKVSPADYNPCVYDIEADWSAASYWYEIAALSAGFVKLRGLCQNSLQGDSSIAGMFRHLGIDSDWDEEPGVLSLMPSPDLTPRINLDLSDTPDVAQTIAVACCMLGLPFRLSGLGTLRIKETDRLTALRNELAKLSFDVDIHDDSVLEWESRRCPVDGSAPIAIDTYDDHRMAMAFAPVALYVPGLIIKNAEVVSKSYPEYWDHLRNAGFVVEPVGSCDSEASES